MMLFKTFQNILGNYALKGQHQKIRSTSLGSI